MSKTKRTPDLIAKKRRGAVLSASEIHHFIHGVVSGEVQDVQIGAMLMSIAFQGMTYQETTNLTKEMMESGETLHWPEEWKGRVVDKHSTGGVGDKVSLPLTPALAACGLKVPMISGRGLQHTGGTLDKLESIPGFQVSVSSARMHEIMDTVGCCIVGQTKALVPADQILYEDRDITATVDSLPLICASIISKKAAEGLDALVLDIKYGRATFMKTKADALRLANAMVSVSKGLGIKTVALLTRMDNPIGRTIGNTLEIIEALHCLHGKGPEDLNELVCKLGGNLLFRDGLAESAEEGMHKIETSLRDGSACLKFEQMLVAQGVEPITAQKLCEPEADYFSIMTPAQEVECLPSLKTGYIDAIDALELAKVSCELGAGRTRAGESIDHTVGMELLAVHGQFVEKGEHWIKIHHNHNLTDEHRSRLQDSLLILDKLRSSHTHRLVSEVIDDPDDTAGLQDVQATKDTKDGEDDVFSPRD